MMTSGIARVAGNALRHFEEVIHPQAVRIFTPFTRPVPLSSCSITAALERFLIAYEPRVQSSGLFPHQAEFLRACADSPRHDFLITTATGSGKSLCFWAWVFDQLARDRDATALLCFPTQALMWGQAERLVRLSDSRSLAYPGGQGQNPPFGGVIALGDDPMGWTIWQGKGQGVTFDGAVDRHEKSRAFASARIRIATLDKAHWSLFRSRENKSFVSRLQCLVLDEAHVYDGVFGANVHYFLKRTYLAREILGRGRPGLFLASATLGSAQQFASTLLALPDTSPIVHIEDSTRQHLDVIPTAGVPEVLARPPAGGLLRVVLFLNDHQGKVSFLPFLGNDQELGTDVNSVFFAASKYMSKRLKLELEGERRGLGRTHLVYDADLPPRDRRELERCLNDAEVKGVTVLATNALELGVDIEGLDACFVDQVPPRRADLIQRIGRVGRREGRPGLVLLRLSAEPQDQTILDDPIAAFQWDASRPMPIPVHLEIVKWRHMLAAFSEWKSAIDYRAVSWGEFHAAVAKHFGESAGYHDLMNRFQQRYGALVDTSEPLWVHNGFRASVSRRKIPLLEGDREVARIDDLALFRDAHPEAVFLGHDLNLYRVVGYLEDRKRASGPDPGRDASLGNWLRAVAAVRVRRERGRVTTRGAWEEGFRLYESKALPDSRERPVQGSFAFGIWDYTRRWQGYTEIDLETQSKRLVTLAEVDERSRQALQRGEPFPFLHEFSYRTFGWEWDFGALPPDRNDPETRKALGILTGAILKHFLAGAAESRTDDLGVRLNLPAHRLQVLDVTPGGNGLSEALLARGRMPSALGDCIRTLDRFTGRGGKSQFQRYVLTLCHQAPGFPAREVAGVVRELHHRWAR